jgi:hypothetical protein
MNMGMENMRISMPVWNQPMYSPHIPYAPYGNMYGDCLFSATLSERSRVFDEEAMVLPTFPDPIFPPSEAQGGQQGQGQNAQHQPYSTGFAPAGYLMNNPYPPQ